MSDEQQSSPPAGGDDPGVDPAQAPTREVATGDQTYPTLTGDPGAATAAAATATGETAEAVEAGTGEVGGPRSGGSMVSGYGWISALLGLVSVAAVVVGVITWSAHRSDVEDRSYRSKVLQTAASWTSLLINLNAENVDTGMQRLHDKTVGELNREFEAAVAPYREVVQRIQARSSGRIEAVVIESLDRDLDGDTAESGAPGGGRTESVVVIATSIAENVAGGRPVPHSWALHLDVSDVDGQLLISRLRSLK